MHPGPLIQQARPPSHSLKMASSSLSFSASTQRQSLHGNALSGSGRAGPKPVQRQLVLPCRAMSADKLLKRPELKRPDLPKPADAPAAPQQPEHAAAPGAAAPAAAAAAAPAAAAEPAAAGPSSSDGVTIEWQRQRAKEMRQYFIDKKVEDTVKDNRIFGWTPTNEIGNGRWVMFGVFVGLLTEYATGVDFPNQIKLMLTYLGIVDAE